MGTLHFSTAENYLRTMHPEFNFVFSIERNALAYWGYTREVARAAQSDMVEMACSHAKRLDRSKGLEIVIEDQSAETPAKLAVVEPARDWIKRAS